LAQAERLPSDYVEQILLRLRRAGIVTSMRGSHGGYELARPPAVVSVREVLTAAEHATFDLHCVSHPVDAGRCADTGSCSIRPVWLLLQSKIDETLEGVKLADLLPVEREVRERVGLPVLYA
jgi:Rrf2 family protein